MTASPPRTADRMWFFWVVAFLSLCFVVNTKTYLLAIACVGFVSFFSFRLDFVHSLFMMLLYSLPFERTIREWTFTVVQPGIELWQTGYGFVFGISPKMLISTLLFLLLMPTVRTVGSHTRTNMGTAALLAFFGFAVIAALNTPDQSLAVAGLSRLGMSLFIFFAGAIMFRRRLNQGDYPTYMVAMLLLFGTIGTVQFLLKRPIGVDMEDIRQVLGYVTTDGPALFRASGFTNHPTYFASQISMLYPVALANYLLPENDRPIPKLITMMSLALGGIAIIGTYSRSAWISLILPIAVLPAYAGFRNSIKAVTTTPFWKPILLGLYLVCLTTGTTIGLRLSTLFDAWNTGNGPGRVELIRQALNMTREFPITGVGINSFTSGMVGTGVSEQFRGFIYPVHNTFLLIVSEMGIPAGLAFVGFLLYVLTRYRHRPGREFVHLGLLLGICTFLVNSQFQTLFNQDASFDMLMLFLGILSVV